MRDAAAGQSGVLAKGQSAGSSYQHSLSGQGGKGIVGACHVLGRGEDVFTYLYLATKE